MKIKVDKRHIVLGQCHVAQKCMIAAAIKDIDPSIAYVSVRTNCITVTKRKGDEGDSVREHYAVPTKVARAIIKFDAGEPVSPFSFNTRLIDRVVIPAVSREKAKQDNARTRARRAAAAKFGIPAPKYGRKTRIAGV